MTIEDARLDFLGNKLDQSSTGDLKNKLKMAAMKIVQLAKENQQLTESNNRLRMELKKSAQFLLGGSGNQFIPVRSSGPMGLVVLWV